jgi:hypothetical protein
MGSAGLVKGRDNSQRRERDAAGATPAGRTMDTTTGTERLRLLKELGLRRLVAHARLAAAARGPGAYVEAGAEADALDRDWQAAWARASDAERESLRGRA